MAESIKISELGELVSGSVVGTNKIPVVDGGETKYTQASSIKAYVSSDLATDAELAAQISAVNSTIDGLTTADISENASFLYYTDNRVTSRLNALSVLSGSSTSLTVSDGDTNVTAVDKITFNNATVFNAGSGDVTVTVPSSLTVGDGLGIPISSVDTITFPGATIVDNTNGDITVTISGTATNISELNSFTSSANSSINSINSTTGSINLFTGSIRGEVSEIEAYTSSLKAASIVSSSQQITNLGFATTSSLISSGLISSSQQITDFGFTIGGGAATIPIGTVSSSQQIVEFGFVTTGSLATGPNFHIISQSVIATDPIDSNLLLSSVYVDKTRTITFSQFSSSLNTRINSAGGGGSTDYVSNVTFGNNRLTFTGVGSAFNNSVTLADGIVSSSIQINNLGFLTATDVNQTYIVNRLPSGVISGSTQISDSGFLNNSSGVVSSSAQIVLLNTISGGFDTSHVAENANYQYYTNAKVENVLNGLTLVSGSVLPSGSVSSSSQIDYQLVFNKVLFYTGSNNVFITSGSQSGPSAYGSPWVSIEVLSPTLTEFNTISDKVYTSGLISSSTQLTDLGFIDNNSLVSLNEWTGSTVGTFGIFSASISTRIDTLSNIPITSSEQVDYNFIQNAPTFAPGDGILISQSLENAITITSNASAPIWDSITFKPNDLVSSSLQVDGYHLFAKTGSTNTFYDNQTVNGEIQTTDLTVTAISDFQGEANFGGISTFNGPVSNEWTLITIAGGTASLDFGIGNLFEIQLDPTATTHISASNISVGQTATLLITTAAESTASFSSNIKQPLGSFYTASLVGSIDIITFTTFNSDDVYVTSVKNNFV